MPKRKSHAATMKKRLESLRTEVDSGKRGEMKWRSGIGDKGTAKTFETFEVGPGKEHAFDEARGWYPDGRKGLLFHGPTGVGKSHLAYAIVNSMIDDHGIFTRFLPTVRMPKHDSEEIERLGDPDEYPVLVLDDVGAEKHTDRALECLYEVVDERVRLGAPLIVTTNFRPEALRAKLNAAGDGYGDRLVGRFREGCDFVAVGGKDHRQEEG